MDWRKYRSWKIEELKIGLEGVQEMECYEVGVRTGQGTGVGLKYLAVRVLEQVHELDWSI